MYRSVHACVLTRVGHRNQGCMAMHAWGSIVAIGADSALQRGRLPGAPVTGFTPCGMHARVQDILNYASTKSRNDVSAWPMGH